MISLLGVECKTSLKIISNCFIGFSQRIPLIPVLTHQCRMEESQGVLNIRAAWPSKSSKQGFCSTGAGPYQNIWINSTKAVEIFPKQKNDAQEQPECYCCISSHQRQLQHVALSYRQVESSWEVQGFHLWSRHLALPSLATSGVRGEERWKFIQKKVFA